MIFSCAAQPLRLRNMPDHVCRAGRVGVHRPLFDALWPVLNGNRSAHGQRLPLLTLTKAAE